MHPDDISDANYPRLRSNLEYLIRVTKENDIGLDFASATQACENFTKS